MWGSDVHDSYCGPGMVTWGNRPLKPTEVYVLWRGINDLMAVHGGRFGGFRLIFLSVSTYSSPAYRGRQTPGCPNLTWKIDTLTNSAGVAGLPTVYTGDSALWKITIASGNPPVRGDIRIKFTMDGSQIYARDIGLLGWGATVWAPLRGWNTGDEAKLHTVSFELDCAGVKCDSQTYQFPVVKRPVQSQQPVTGSNWLRPHLIDGWQRTVSPAPAK
jgi:hypothetical protein